MLVLFSLYRRYLAGKISNLFLTKINKFFEVRKETPEEKIVRQETEITDKLQNLRQNYGKDKLSEKEIEKKLELWEQNYRYLLSLNREEYLNVITDEKEKLEAMVSLVSNPHRVLIPFATRKAVFG